MVLLLDLNCSPPEEEDNNIPGGGNVDHPDEEEGIDNHVHEDAGTILSLQACSNHTEDLAAGYEADCRRFASGRFKQQKEQVWQEANRN